MTTRDVAVMVVDAIWTVLGMSKQTTDFDHAVDVAEEEIRVQQIMNHDQPFDVDPKDIPERF